MDSRSFRSRITLWTWLEQFPNMKCHLEASSSVARKNWSQPQKTGWLEASVALSRRWACAWLTEKCILMMTVTIPCYCVGRCTELKFIWYNHDYYTSLRKMKDFCTKLQTTQRKAHLFHMHFLFSKLFVLQIAGVKQWASRHSRVALAAWLLHLRHWWSNIIHFHFSDLI